jgi:hypothetical protein
MNNRILISSLSADTNNYIYDTVIVNGTGPYSVTFNGVVYSLAGPQTLNINVNSVQSGNSNILLSGYLTTFEFPVYLGNSWSTDYRGNPIVQTDGGGVLAQSGNTQYAYYK